MASVFNPVEMGFGPEEERVSGYCRRGHASGVELVFPDDFERAACFEDHRFALFTGKVDPFSCQNWGGGIVAAHAFLPEGIAGFCVQAAGDAAVLDHEQKFVVEDDRGFAGNTPDGFPNHTQTRCGLGGVRLVGVDDRAIFAGLDSEELSIGPPVVR